ncbi:MULTISPECIES: YlxM family DNA-binding protein [Oscillospiraceae]|uniref:UPF0122 protein H8S62_02485 n=1 Tax=Lawsonibacter faecis TaxID=2763052 RepID=A0A8J6JJC0_9FIRM|nr:MULTISPECIES: sigma factor-like helix-turn-helix DNA-binding protein [Oscillospiraceae]MTQ97279.1 DNA-binding protein [Pseudoflavonifractor sp. BIOML-A16]MTR05318.1 DNA-binding protein [Pseudoflavonifractor sp. BIOML-A15]MTR31584.1 DNA-binding protein [Pseudoflavonifractor sp. BIOML-A14]MTR72270.1 DNA-binding protein [Pseudoflavonifractor sp. BIOML-A18]MTS62990.1 DNA-binding protein [Pseudoflavonifractor sp. BIOML-A5]MTS70672.1 DNA-binding protein [Pseudoflavonifractor sp. BIOML-A8]MTS913
MKNQAFRMALLFDFYGDMLTDRQKEFFDLYYNEDLSLSEIAENYGITRQGVRDVIVRAEGIMQELEDKTGIIRRFQRMQEQFSDIERAADGILAINSEHSYDSDIETLATEIKDAVSLMKQE